MARVVLDTPFPPSSATGRTNAAGTYPWLGRTTPTARVRSSLFVLRTRRLNRQYTVFGEVVSGMEVVDKIVTQPRDANNNPNDRIEMKVKIVEGK